MRLSTVFLAVTLAAVPACKSQNSAPLTAGEAAQALEELSVESQASALVGASVEISTSFTIGAALEAAAAELRSFIESQLPCAEVSLSKSTLEVEYGALPGSCVYRGMTYSGSHTITLSHNDASEIVVDHAWDGLQNGIVSVSGAATVTWSVADPSRHVVHELTWTRLVDGRTGTGSGDRVQRPLADGIAVGFVEDGSRSWQGNAGLWELDIDQLEMRWVDPVPQSGALTLVTPAKKSLTVSFERVDDDTIAVTLASGGGSFTLDVNKLGT